ncbi:MAG: alanine racemase [Flavobacteriaceae bacterium]|jgi:alanine racemase|nr:alanine racemase [Flavobacteriaceae bacterium]MDG2289544.1 alanine racemase [Flavobacteriaceae bacterium]
MSETVLEIHLPNLRHNYTFLRNQLSANTKLLAVVKAFGYGSDAVEVAKCLVAQGVDYLGVAYIHEGVALRKAGITTPILVLHPQLPNLDALIEYKLEPSVYGQRILDALLSKIKESNVSHYPVHLKFNTGLNRLGFNPKDATALLELFKDNALWLLLQGVYSHLAASDDEGESAFTKTQLKTFSEIVAVFSPTHPKTTFHVLNTSGVLHFPEAQYNMVRTGISLYGYGNHPSVDAQLKPVLRLRTVISQIHTLEEGDTLGYNRAFVAKAKTKTATLPLGHADGIGRIYGNGKGYVMINGQQASILGNVCMDMIMVDVTSINCQEGDEVVVIGPDASAENVANAAGTISYELITGLSHRIQRKVIT